MVRWQIFCLVSLSAGRHSRIRKYLAQNEFCEGLRAAGESWLQRGHDADLNPLRVHGAVLLKPCSVGKHARTGPARERVAPRTLGTPRGAEQYLYAYTCGPGGQ